MRITVTSPLIKDIKVTTEGSMLEDPVTMGGKGDPVEEVTEVAIEEAIEGAHPDSTKTEATIPTEIIF